MVGYASEVSYFTPSLLLMPRLALYVLVIVVLGYLIIAMKILGLRKVLISLLLGCISSIILLLYIASDYDAKMPLLPVFLWQALFFSIVFLYASLLLESKRENLKEINHLKTFKKLGMALQIFLVFLTVSIFYLPILSNFFYMFSILLLCIGGILYYQTKSKISVSFIVWGLAILGMTYLMTFLIYGF